MRSIPTFIMAITVAFACNTLLVCAADPPASGDQSKKDEIKIPLKDFKFKPPASVSDPDSVFVFNEDEGRLCFYTNGPAEAKFKLPTDGDWDVIVSASGDIAVGVPQTTANGKKEVNIPPNFQLGFDGKNFGKEITLKSDDQKDYKIVVPLKAGEHVISVAFTNDTYDPDGKFDSNLYLHGVKLRPHQPDEPKKDDAKK
ncbi:MAG TPA: carbohydrate-binding domain-containing protein [Pirellulales bacterium]|jgi:hypothetical protein|nr:carbohydrate-binding domain-containing protein [Pirellulales bacterium]